jgi:hypothetical protein
VVGVGVVVGVVLPPPVVVGVGVVVVVLPPAGAVAGMGAVVLVPPDAVAGGDTSRDVLCPFSIIVNTSPEAVEETLVSCQVPSPGAVALTVTASSVPV